MSYLEHCICGSCVARRERDAAWFRSWDPRRLFAWVAWVSLLVLWAWLVFGCASPDDPRSLDASTDVSYPDASVDAHPDSPAPRPPHDVTPVCADDAAGCQDADVPYVPCYPPYCLGGNLPPNHNQTPGAPRRQAEGGEDGE